jgi:hypothetical protein
VRIESRHQASIAIAILITRFQTRAAKRHRGVVQLKKKATGKETNHMAKKAAKKKAAKKAPKKKAAKKKK